MSNCESSRSTIFLFHFSVNYRHGALLNVRKLLNLLYSVVKDEPEDILVVNVENVSKLNVIDGQLFKSCDVGVLLIISFYLTL